MFRFAVALFKHKIRHMANSKRLPHVSTREIIVIDDKRERIWEFKIKSGVLLTDLLFTEMHAHDRFKSDIADVT